MDNPSICVIDDEPDLVEACADILTKAGYGVEKCTDSEKGLQLITDREFDVVLVDLMMPKVNGIKILQEVKKVYPQCMVIIFTGYPTIESAVSAMRDGAFDYLVKPFMANQLTTLISKAVAKRNEGIKNNG
jgi:DNA-binding NtrC family response regulator